jgi:NADH:ubiquinone oxidoreductase subunit C
MLDNNHVNNIAALANNLKTFFPKWIDALSIENDQVVLYPHKHIRKDLNTLLYTLSRSSLFKFNSLNDLFGVDLLNYPSSFTSSLNSNLRYEVHYYLLSYTFKLRLRVVTGLYANKTELNTVTTTFLSANWLEREVWDLYGIHFYNHPDLRRILTDYGFSGFPLRKEFPLTGYVEVRYSEKRKRVVLKPVALSQEYRRFEFTTPWDKFYLK